MSFSLQLEEALRAAQTLPQVFAFDEIDSTNSEAKRMAVDGFDGVALVAAVHQSAGRGRMGRSFYSPAHTGAYFSILYKPASPLFDAVRITGAVAVAVMCAIRALTGKQTEIKWVNDLYLEGKKVCGILAEAVSVGESTHVILGIGVNLCTEDFPDGLAQIAGALGEKTLSPAALIAQIYCELEQYLFDPANLSWLEDYRRCSMVIGKEITWIDRDGAHRGRAEEIDGEGALLVRAESGEAVRLSTGEISLRLR